MSSSISVLPALKPSNSKRIQFLQSFNPQQNWSLPDSIIFYITKNPSSAKLYQKLIQSCKYFFIKNPIIILKCLHVEYDEYKTCGNGKCALFGPKYDIDIALFLCKFWISDEIFNHCLTDQNLMSPIVPKLFNANFHSLHLSKQILSFDEFRFLVSNASEIDLCQITVKYSNGKEVEFEKLVQSCPNAIIFNFEFKENSSIISSKTVKELITYLPKSSIATFCLENLSETFNIKKFFNEFCKKNKEKLIDLIFADSLSDNYLDQLEEVLTEIIETKKFEYFPPRIQVPGLDDDVQEYLNDIADANYLDDN